MADRPKGYKERIGPWLAKKEILKGMGVDPADVVVLDVGAYRGDYTAMYQRMWPKAEYHLFEPQPKAVEGLRGRFEGQDRVHIIKTALSNLPREDALFYEGGRDGEMSSMYPRPIEGRRYYRHLLSETAYRVPVSTLDIYVKETGIKKIHLLKVDIHGSEGPLIEGAKYVLRYKKPPILYFEVFFVPLYDGACLYTEIASRLGKYGYSVFDFYGMTRCKISRQVSFADAMFISNDVREKVINKYPEEWLAKSMKHAMGMP